NIRVNCIAPGLIKTDFARALWEDKARLAAREEQTPLRRIGEPDEIAGAAVLLASPAGPFLYRPKNVLYRGGPHFCGPMTISKPSAQKPAPGWRRIARRRCASRRRTKRISAGAAAAGSFNRRRNASGSSGWRRKAGPRRNGRRNTAAADFRVKRRRSCKRKC